MLRAARRGHEVLFVETGYFLGRHLWSLVRGRERRSLARRLFSTEEVASGVRLRKALNVLPWGSTYRTPEGDQLGGHGASVARLAAGCRSPSCCGSTTQGAAGMAGRCGEAFAVYDCVDDYAEQTTSARKRATGRELRSNGRTPLAARLHDEHHDVRAAAPPQPREPISCRTPATTSTSPRRPIAAFAGPEVSDLPRPVLGFAGNFLASKVDFGLLEDVARALPQCDRYS